MEKPAAEPAAQLSLHRYEICHTNASISNVTRHKNIRLLSQQGVIDLKQHIKTYGFKSGSHAVVVERSVVDRTPLHTICNAYRQDQTVPAGTSIQTIGVSGLLNVEEEDDLMRTRRYRLVDGSHRLAALMELAKEAEAAGNEELADKYRRIPVVVLYGLSEEAIACLATKLNSDNKNYVKTTNLNTYTAVQVQLQHWAHGDGLSDLKTAVAEATSEEAKEKAEATLEAHKDGVLNMREFCRWQCAVLDKYGQTLQDIYNWGIRPHNLCAHVANVLTREEAAYYQSLYDAEVRLVLDLLFKRIENPFEMLCI